MSTRMQATADPAIALLSGEEAPQHRSRKNSTPPSVVPVGSLCTAGAAGIREALTGSGKPSETSAAISEASNCRSSLHV